MKTASSHVSDVRIVHDTTTRYLAQSTITENHYFTQSLGPQALIKRDIWNFSKPALFIHIGLGAKLL